MKKTDSFCQPLPGYGGTYPNNWAGYIHLQKRTPEGLPNLRHLGDDYNGPGGGDTDEGLRVEAIADGVVEKVIAWNGAAGFGNHIFIRHELSPELREAIKRDYKIDTDILYSHYAHLKQNLAWDGMEVLKGQLIAYCGKTGTKWAHLHCELRKGTGLGYESYPSGNSVEWINQYYLSPFEICDRFKNPIPGTTQTTSNSTSSSTTSSSSSTTSLTTQPLPPQEPPVIIPPVEPPNLPPTDEIPPLPNDPGGPILPPNDMTYSPMMKFVLALLQWLRNNIGIFKDIFKEKGGGNDMEEIKPGWQSTEFWATLATAIVGILALAGKIDPADSDDLIKAIIAIAGGVITIITSVTYVISRSQLKKESMKLESQRLQISEGAKV
jgi:murein DD-endopeptidase MepM/ murein hydrolase activator NlpD